MTDDESRRETGPVADHADDRAELEQLDDYAELARSEDAEDSAHARALRDRRRSAL